jgi:hypothetical protein
MAAPTSAVKPAARYNFAYVPGDSRPIIFRLRTAVGPFNPDGEMILSITWPGGSLTKSSLTPNELTVDPVTGIVKYTPTEAETRSFLSGRSASYRLQRRAGDELRTYIMGTINAFQ